MAFGMSPFPLQFGSRDGGGDPTVLTDAILTSLGFASTRTGEVYGRRAPGGPGNYVRHATNDPEFDFTEVDGKNYPSLIVRGAATPLISYSADLTNAAWTKTNCTAELVTGSLESAATPNGHSLVTATANNATVTRQLTRASANRNTRWKIKAPNTNVGDVLVSHGDVTGATNIAANGTFDSGADWTLDADGRSVISGGVLTYTPTGVAVSDIDRNTGTDLVAGRTYQIAFDVTANTLAGTTLQLRAKCSSSPFDFSALLNIRAAVIGTTSQQLYFTPLASGKLELRWFVDASATGAISIDNLSVKPVVETILTPGTFHDIELGEYTGANPFLAIHLTDNGDAVEHYDVQMAELAAGTPVPNFVPQGATPAAVGAASVVRTSVDLADTYDVDALVVFRGVSNAYVIQHADMLSDFFEIYMTSSQRASVRVREGGGTVYGAISPSSTFVDGEVVKISGTYSGGDIDLLKDDVSVDTETGATDPEGTGTVYLGHTYGASGFASTHIIAIRDNAGTILGEAGKGFNLGALERYEASL